jgi:tetratricopeptide (TPR) repeat protein
VAAVIGREFEFRLLHRASGLDEASAAEGVEELIRRRVLHGVGERFEFPHHRLQAVVYDQLLPPRRKLLHRRTGEALEALSSVNPVCDPLALGLHFREGEVWDKAIRYLRAAGVDATARSAYREAVTCFEQALALSERLPETRERLEQAIDLRLDLRMSLHPQGTLERGLGHLRDAERLARILEDPLRLGWVSVYLSHVHCLRQEVTEARSYGQTALAIGEARADFGLTVAASLYLGMTSHDFGSYLEAEDFYQRGLRALGSDRSRERCGLAGFPAVMVRARLAQTLAMRGEFQQGVAHGHEAMQIAEELDHPYSLITACYALGFLYRTKGDLSQAAHLIEHGLTLSDRWNIRLWSPTLLVILGHVYAWSGRVPEAISLLRSTAEEFESIYARPETGYILALGEVYVLAGHCDDALSLAEQATAFASGHGLRGVEARSLHLLAEIAVHRNRPNAAESEEYYGRALALAEELGMRPLVAHCHLGFGKLYHRTDEREQAREHLATATTMYREMGMTYWLEKAETEMTNPAA